MTEHDAPSGSSLRAIDAIRRDPAMAWATMAAGLVVSAATLLAAFGLTRIGGGFPPQHAGLLLVPVCALLYAAPALAVGAVLGGGRRLETGAGPAALTIMATCAMGALLVAALEGAPGGVVAALVGGALTALLCSPVVALGVVVAEVIRRRAAGSDGSGLVGIVGGILWAAAWLLSV